MSLVNILAALLVVGIWGFNFVVIKIGLTDVPPFLLAALRFVFAAVPAVFFVPRPPVPWRSIISFSLLQFVGQFGFLFLAMELGMPAGLASLLLQVQVFFTIGLGALIARERPGVHQVVGAAIGFLGLALVASQVDGEVTGVALVLIVLSAFSWAAGNTCVKRIGAVNALHLVIWASLIASVPLAIFSLLFEGWTAIEQSAARLSTVTTLAILYLAYPTTLLGYGIWNWLLRRYPAATVAPFTLLVPVVGYVSAALVLNESLEMWKVAAGLLVLTGLAVNIFGNRLWSWLRPILRSPGNR